VTLGIPGRVVFSGGWYNVNKLVFYESSDDVRVAIAREKQIKAGSRAKKIALIEGMNPEWQDLYEELA
jgi:putative endonuclease